MVGLTMEIGEHGEVLMEFTYGRITWKILVPILFTINDYINKYYTRNTRMELALKKYLAGMQQDIADIEIIRNQIRRGH